MNVEAERGPRKPKPVTVTLEGDPRDVRYWIELLQIRVRTLGDNAVRLHPSAFIIQPKGD